MFCYLFEMQEHPLSQATVKRTNYLNDVIALKKKIALVLGIWIEHLYVI